MIEIIPNWHPIFVHFTIGLLSISTVFYIAGAVLKKEHFFTVARWNLWIGGLITVGTILAGWYAYNTVNHDGPSHAAMTDHRNWALTTATIFIFLALWAFWKQRGAKTVGVVFVALMVLASAMLAVTGYKGGEVVYRHGLGVMRMPEVHGDGGHSSHGHGEESSHHGNRNNSDENEKVEESTEQNDGHSHAPHSEEHAH